LPSGGTLYRKIKNSHEYVTTGEMKPKILKIKPAAILM